MQYWLHPENIYGIEIKSDADTYTRLAKQVKYYNLYIKINPKSLISYLKITIFIQKLIFNHIIIAYIISKIIIRSLLSFPSNKSLQSISS